MKLLLTSSGFTNQSIENAFRELVGKSLSETLVAFIPTASNIVDGDKWWVVTDFIALHNLGCKVDIVDISALPKDIFMSRLGKADVILVQGGDTFYLMDTIHESGCYEDFKQILLSKVYVGVSAGSAICAKDCALKASQEMYGEVPERKNDIQGLNLVPFYIFPHYGSKEWFPKVTKSNTETLAKMYSVPIYLIDDNSAILINEKEFKVISEGLWEKIG